MRSKKSHTYLFYAFIGILILATIIIAILLFSGPNKSLERFTNAYTFDYFMMESCGHCQDFEEAGTWSKLQTAVANNNIPVNLNKYNYSKDGESRAAQFGVNSFPTFILIKDNVKVAEYNGPREVDPMLSFIQSHISHA